MRANKICPYCNEEFKPKRSNQQYCIPKHGWDHRNEKKKNVWDNPVIKRLKSNDDLLRAVFENPTTNGSCSWDYLISLGFHGSYITHHSTVGHFKYSVMIKYGYLKNNNNNVTIKQVYE